MNEFDPQQKGYWESGHYPAWSASIVFPLGGIPDGLFVDTVVRLAQADVHRYTGFITRDTATGNVASFTRSIVPRRKYQTVSPEVAAQGMDRLAKAFSTAVIPEKYTANSFRAVLGLYSGQQDSYDRPPDTTCEYVQHILQQRELSCTVIAAEVFTVRFGEQGITTYAEPVAVVNGPLDELNSVCELGVELEQERFTIETFVAGHSPSVQMVETMYCQEPEFADNFF